MKNKKGENDITAETAKKATTSLNREIKNKETNGSNVFNMESTDIEADNVVLENFKTSLDAIENDFEELMKLSNALSKNEIEQEKIALSEHDYCVAVDSIDARLKSLNSLYRQAQFPEVLKRLNDASVMLDAMKPNQARFRNKQSSNE